jgi:hypothetical protein
MTYPTDPRVSDERMMIREQSNSLPRREFLRSCGLGAGGLGFGGIALASLLARETTAAHTPYHFPPRAKRIIYLHMIGAPSQLDLFVPKPELVKRHNEPCPPEVTKDRDFAFLGKTSTLAGSPWKFAQHGQAGHYVSELLPHLAGVTDQLAMIHSMHTEEINHAPAQMFLHSGFARGGRPSLGSWVSYGLGSENDNLPGYIVLLSGPMGGAGTNLWSNGFLPSVHQGIQFRSQGDPVLFLTSPKKESREAVRRVIETVADLNKRHLQEMGDPEIETRIEQYEMAFRMQASVPDLMKIEGETRETLELYGATPGKASFANNCLLARRLVERGVRLIELYDADWDHHGQIEKRLPEKCRQTDQPIAALIHDLKRRGLLDDTLLVWGSEFGRTPLRQGGDANDQGLSGRDHHKDAFTIWLAGGGIQPGTIHGRTDELGMDIVENPVHIHDLNATILHLLGLDHRRLTFRYQGREFRLTDVHGNVIREILSA